jgi:hypothetical protein
MRGTGWNRIPQRKRSEHLEALPAGAQHVIHALARFGPLPATESVLHRVL